MTKKEKKDPKDKEHKEPEKKTITRADMKDDSVLSMEMSAIRKIAAMIEANNIEEFLDLRRRPWKLIWWNLVIGLFRGIGFLLGATVVGAIIIALGANFVKQVVASLGGMPWIGEKIAALVIHVNELIQNSGVKGP